MEDLRSEPEMRPEPGRPPVIAPGYTYQAVDEEVGGIVLTRRPPLSWFIGFGVGFLLLLLFLTAVTYLLARGVGIWGVNVPVAWGFAIVNFVWWIGIGHAGTLISAILYLLNQRWRTSINRFAEAMTLFAVACAAMFPLLHLGRPWLFYWLFPIPLNFSMWPQFRSPLVWDVFAVSTYGLVSLIFWYIGLVPDLATLRDRARGRLSQIVYGIMAMGWRGSAGHWRHYHKLYLLLAGLATPLVVSVHTVVSFDFTIAILPGWHSTIFPPYFVAGAIYSGFAMVLSIAIPLRKFYRLDGLITLRHLENCAKIMLATGLIVGYGYLMEAFMGWYSANGDEWFETLNRAHGPYRGFYWGLLTCNVFVPQMLWSQRVRRNVGALFVISLVVNSGMWIERFVIVAVSLHRDFLTSSWGAYLPTVWDYATFLGTIGLFLSLLFLFFRFLPSISITEVKELVAKSAEGSA